MVDLMLHCGANHVERSALAKVELPAATDTHTPIAHDYFADLIQDRLDMAGLKVINEGFGLGRGGADLFGLFEVGSNAKDDFATIVGFRNSHAKKLSAGLACGSGVFVCDNLMFTGEVTFGRRHTSKILDNLGGLVTDAISRIKGMKDSMDVRFEAYKSRTLYKSAGDSLIVEMLRQGVINTQRVEKVVAEWDNPSHDEFRKHGFTPWRLMNATTEALKGSNIIELPARTQKMQSMLDDICDIEIAEAA